MSGQQVNIWLPTSLLARIDKLAQEAKRTRSNYLALVIEQHANEIEAAQRRGRKP